MEKNLNPIIIRNSETKENYTLTFTRESVKYAQRAGFNVGEVDVKPMIVVPDLFYYAFRANHKNVGHDKTDKILFEDLGGMSEPMLDRLIDLYMAPYNTLVNKDDNSPKNSNLTVEM